MYWNTDKYNSLPLEDPEYGISNITGKYINNHIYCQFTRQSFTTIQDPSFNSPDVNDFDLNNKHYYVLMAKGPTTKDDILKQHTKAVATKDAIGK